MNNKIHAILAWIYFGLIAVSYTLPGLIDLVARPASDRPLLVEIIFPVIPVAFALFGTLIITRQAGNRIGLLMLLPTLSFFPLVDAYLRPFINGLAVLPQVASPAFLLILWFSGWNWILFVFPVIFLILLFPSGRPLSPRWNGLVYVGLFLAALLPVSATFSQSLTPGSEGTTWSYPNPIGFLDVGFIDKILAPFFFVFPAWIILCVISLFVRFHRYRGVERQQIKWLFFAAAVFAGCYLPGFLQPSFDMTDNLWGLLFAIGMLAFPAAIAIAILRHRLFDIDLVIRRTFQYSLVTGVLALVYFGAVTVLQSLFAAASGEQSTLAIVLSTLAIAALFNPLRRWVQEAIDRRFFRRKYNAEQALSAFAAIARTGADIEHLTDRLIGTVQESLQPTNASLWLLHPRPGQDRKHS